MVRMHDDTTSTTTAPPTELETVTERRRSGDRWAYFMIGLGIFGLVTTAVVAALGLRLVDRSGSTVARSLELTAEAVTTVEETVSAAADSVGVATEGLSTLSSAVAGARSSLAGIGGLLDDSGDAIGDEVPESIDAIRASMPALIQSAELLDTALNALSFAGVDYDPEVPPAESLRQVDRGLMNVAQLLRDGSDGLRSVGRDFDSLGTDTAELRANLQSLRGNLERADELLAGYAATTGRVAALVEDTSNELHAQRREARIIVVLFGLILGAAHVVPLSLGLRARRQSRTRFEASASG